MMADENSRVNKSIKNASFNIVNQLISVLLEFALRTLFIRTLALEYLGVSGLFSNILTMLSLTELGIGTAIVCNLYKPLANRDEQEIAKYFHAYKIVYTVIGIVIMVIGLFLTPFLPYLIADSSNIPNLSLIYILYLLDTVASYFYAQYRSLLSADQKDYINANNKTLFLIIRSIAQAAVLLIFHSYIIYMIVRIVCNLCSGYVISIRTKKIYPFLGNTSYEKLSVQEIRGLAKDTSGVFSNKISMTVLNSTDNLVMSTFLGSIITAYYSNYGLLFSTISTAANLVFSSVTASMGNFYILHNKDNNLQMFRNVNYVFYCIYSFCSICLLSLSTPFIKLWLGDDFTLGVSVIMFATLKFYFSNARQATLNLLTVSKLLPKLNVKNIVEVVINIGVSIILVQRIGLVGIFIGTCVSLITTSLWYEPYVLYKNCFEKGLIRYYVSQAIYLIVFAAGCSITLYLQSLVFYGTLLSFVLYMIVVVMIAAAVVTVPFVKTNEFKYLIHIATSKIKLKK